MDKITRQQQARQIASQYLARVRQNMPIKYAVLFGSVARGTMTKDSDIDLILISPLFKGVPLMKRLAFLSQMRGREFAVWPMDIFGYTAREFNQLTATSSMFAEAKKQGIIIK